MSEHYQFGAWPIAGGLCRFRLWAPGQPAITLLRRDQPPLPMQALEDGWWQVEATAPAGTRYRFALGDGPNVPDPASHGQDGDVDGWSVVQDHGAYRWKHADWRTHPWPQTVVYELHAGAMGGFRGVIAELPRLASLGVNTIELMPVNDFAGIANWGYDGVLPYAPDETYGSPDELKALVDAAHGQGIAVMLDVVYNHFGPAGNYWHAITPDFFRSDISTPWGEAIDFRHDAVRDFFIQNAIFWLREYRFDGLRLDAVHAIASETFLSELSDRVRAATEGRPVYLVLENERNDASLLEQKFEAQWNDDAHHCLHVLLTGEDEAYYADYADAPAEHLARALSEGFVYQGEESKNLGHARGQKSGHLPASSFVNALQNHDQVGNRAFGDRIFTLAPPDAVRAALLVLLLTPPVPMLFMGDEYAAERPFLFFTGFGTPELATAVREGRRKEFARFSSFADPERRERIPDPNDPKTFAASSPQPGDRAHPANVEAETFCRFLLETRTKKLARRLDGAQSLGAAALGDRAIRAQWRLADGAVLSVAAQFGDESLPCPQFPGEPIAASGPGAGEAALGGELPPRSAIAWLQEPAG